MRTKDILTEHKKVHHFLAIYLLYKPVLKDEEIKRIIVTLEREINNKK